MKEFLCPFCLQRHKKSDLIYRCMGRVCRYDVHKNEFGIVPNKDVGICEKKCDQRIVAICPDPETAGSKIIPNRAMEQSMSIALLGGRNSGKSNYIAILVNEIKRKMSGRFDSSLMPCDDTTEARYKAYFYDPIFKNHRALESTDSGRQDPLLFTMDFYKKKFGGKTAIESLLLPLYDTAGENMASDDKLASNVNYIKSAGGMIILLDPFEIEEIAVRLEDNGIPGRVNATSMEEVLDRVEKILEGNDTGKIIDIPVAIVLTKLDLLNDYTDLVPDDSVLRQESAHLDYGYFSKREQKAVGTAVRDLLIGCDQTNNLFNKLRRFKNAEFFAVSSFGCDPTVGDLKSSMKPLRVLDPLLWLLSINGYIDSGK